MLSADTRAGVATLAAHHRWPRTVGRIRRIVGLLVEATVKGTSIGDIIEVDRATPGCPPLRCEVVGVADGAVLAIGLGPVTDISLGARVVPRHELREFPVGDALLGRVLDPFGEPIDGGPRPRCESRIGIDGAAPSLEDRALVTDVFETGVRVIDGLLTCGRGQRVGIFAGAGVGKSVLVEQIARQAKADVVVIGLVGERGREVRELASASTEQATVIVAATSDRSPMERVRGARAATAVAEHFSKDGARVLLIVDSLTRYAMALREIGLALGEPAATKGYPPSVFAELPRLLERASSFTSGGSITGFYTVLVEGDDLSDPIADAARSLLDGHVILDRELAGRAHFPAVDVLASASRVMTSVRDTDSLRLAQTARTALADRRQVAELVSLGAYLPGSNAEFDHALDVGRRLDQWARQDAAERSDDVTTLLGLAAALNPNIEENPS